MAIYRLLQQSVFDPEDTQRMGAAYERALVRLDLKDRNVACTRFRRHRVRCFDGAGGGSWNDGSLRESSSLRRCA